MRKKEDFLDLPPLCREETQPVRLHNACITACNFKDAGPISANQKLRYRTELALLLPLPLADKPQ